MVNTFLPPLVCYNILKDAPKYALKICVAQWMTVWNIMCNEPTDHTSSHPPSKQYLMKTQMLNQMGPLFWGNGFPSITRSISSLRPLFGFFDLWCSNWWMRDSFCLSRIIQMYTHVGTEHDVMVCWCNNYKTTVMDLFIRCVHINGQFGGQINTRGVVNVG